MNLTRKTWELGWFPANDSLNGDPSGLLRADNLELDEVGVLSLVDGAQKINSSHYAGSVNQIYSKYINNTKFRYVVLDNGTVFRNDDLIVNGEYYNRVGFTSVLGFNLICAGNTRIKDDGTTIRQLGLKKPDNPPLKVDTAVNETIIGPTFGDWYAEWGTLYPPSVIPTAIGVMTADAGDGVSFWGIAQQWQSWDLSNIGGNPGSDDDIFSIWIADTTTGAITNIQLEFYLQANYPVTDSYSYEWKNPDGIKWVVDSGGTTLKVTRKEFERVGVNPNLDWKDVKSVRVIFKSDCISLNYFANFKITSNFLVGKSYYYATQNVANLGTYVARSPLSAKSEIIEPVGGQVRIKADDPYSGDDTDPQINEIWFFRRASLAQDVIPIGSPPTLDTWYRVGVLKQGEGLELQDKTTDEEALELNIKANVVLISVKDIKEEIIGIVSGYYDRTLYLTPKMVYISEQLNPDSVNPLYTLKFEGGEISQNLWIAKSSLGVVLVGTTQDIFEISGTLVDLPDGSIDCYVKPLAVTNPPLSYDFDVVSTQVFYPAKDGIRSIAPGGVSEVITSPILDLLFQGKSRHGIPAVVVSPKHIEKYPIAITQTHIFISLPFADGQRNVVDLNLTTKSWTFRQISPLSFYVEEDGTVLAGFGNGDNYLRVFNTGTTIDGTTGQTVRILTVFDDNQQPRNRKDVFTLKITANAGSTPVQIWIAKDGEGLIYLGEYTFNGITEHLIRLEGVIDPGKAYELQIEAYNATVFKLHNYTIEYDPFPEQLNFYRIPNNNLGTYSRKRITNYAFVIDTLGNTITFTPIVDGVSLSSSNVVFTGKRTFIHYFKVETLGTDIGGILSGGTFEFYGINSEEIVSEKLPVPVKYLVIPATDYGQPNRKRHSSYKFQINTRGYQVRFTPRLDGVDKASLDFSTSEKLTVEYFFSSDTIAIDIGGVLESLDDEEFEFYGVIKPQEIEVLPARLKEFRIPENNYGIASRKRIRTMPMELNTNGFNVTFTPIVDGILGTPSVLNSATRKTVFHYFETDVFGTDFSGELVGSYAFEFYGLLKPEEVEILPVAKKLDQIGPLRLDKLAKLLQCRIRIITQGVENLVLRFYDEDGLTLGTPIHTETIVTEANNDEIYEFAFPKTIKGSTIRVVIGPSILPFHRYDMQLKLNPSGMDSDPKWIKVK